ncbi:glycosyltransferase family 2 protein [Tahibacter harae]|uniref:Glycosyltransferase family 2 protein n=1 Tax=Tahibacter harae TaxID=2963937 RepID=A0ABT1QPY4_9GAMM|nr:glycosyltransferase family 2 protein [Tahibacter harae]MCQ4164353.1 glycosyltransferase family 2 protein [Tahibacter harae]
MPLAGTTSVIIVAADSGDGLIAGARRVLAADAPLQLIVSDNASSDGSIGQLQREFGGDARLRIVHNGKNLGFGAGVNRAAALADGDCLLVLNPDCLIEHDTLARLRGQARAPRTGVVGVRIQDGAGVDEPASLRRDPTLRRSLCSLLRLDRFAARWPALAGVNVAADAVQRGEDGIAEAISGAVMLFPREAFDAVGGFDEDFFLHCEDLDICRRLRDAGYAVRYAGSIRVPHGKGGSSRHRPVFVAWHKHRGMWLWFRRHDPAARNPLLRVLVRAGIWTRFGLLLPLLLWRKWHHRRGG